jgi:hypothetical protein
MLLFLHKFIPKEGYKVKSLMIYWNLFLSLLSVAIFFGAGIPYYQKVQQYGMMEMICDSKYRHVQPDPMLFWGKII